MYLATGRIKNVMITMTTVIQSCIYIYIYTRILFFKTLVSQFKLFEPYTIVFRILLLMQYIEIILNHKQWPSSSCLQCEMQFSRICFSQCMKAAFVYLLIQSSSGNHFEHSNQYYYV